MLRKNIWNCNLQGTDMLDITNIILHSYTI